MEEDLKPAWLDEGFVMQVLRSVEGLGDNQISISGWCCSRAVPPGTNYLSLVYRLCINYNTGKESRSVSLIVKTPGTGYAKQIVDSVGGIGRELRTYRDLLPRMYEIANNSVTVTPRSYVCPLQDYIVLEDLSVQGYKLADRLQQLDAAHCRQCMITIAKFHGLSIGVHHSHPEVIETVGKNPWFDENQSEESKNECKLREKHILRELVMTIESLGLKRYAEIIKGKIDTYYDTMERIFKPSGELRLLNHGDYWTNNVLFKYNECDEVVDAKLVDFQFIGECSFAQDLIYFWWTSARQEVRENLQEEMFEVYRQTLNKTLEGLKMPQRLTKEEFDSEIRRFAPFALHITVTLLRVAMGDPDDLFELDQLSDSSIDNPVTKDTYGSKNFHSKYYKAILPDTLRQLEKFGAFT